MSDERMAISFNISVYLMLDDFTIILLQHCPLWIGFNKHAALSREPAIQLLDDPKSSSVARKLTGETIAIH